MGIYERIKETGKDKGVSINKLEKELGFPRSSICKFNTNKPGIEKIQKIANYLDVTVDYLLNENNVNNDNAFSQETELSKILQLTKNKLLTNATLNGDKLELEEIQTLLSAIDIGFKMIENNRQEKQKDNKNKKR